MIDIFYPLQWIADKLTYDILRLVKDSNIANSINFIFYDLMKIFLLLSMMVFIVSYLRSYLSPELIREKLAGKNGILYHFIASIIGVISPFCSCSSIPLFIGFIEAGIPLGITFSFLITSPLVNEAAIGILWILFGFKVMALYVISGILIGVVGGLIIHHLKLEEYVEEFVYNIHSKHKLKHTENTQKQRYNYAFSEVRNIIRRVWLYIFIGIGIGGIFHGYLPTTWTINHLGKENILAVPLAILVGVPLYANVLGSIPIIESLIGKGLPIGTALAFMMSITALSLPEMIILKKVLKTRLIITFVAIVSVSIMLTGYLFNIII